MHAMRPTDIYIKVMILARRSLAWAGQLRGPVERRLNVTWEMKR